MEMEGHDRTSIDLPQVQKTFVQAVLGLKKPTVIFLMNAGAVAMDIESIMSDETQDSANAAGRTNAPIAIIEAF